MTIRSVEQRPTFGHDADWERVGLSETTASHRSTTSSRLPGRAITGTVRRGRHQVVTCAVCCQPKVDLGPGAHAPHWESRGGELVQVDCVGREVAA